MSINAVGLVFNKIEWFLKVVIQNNGVITCKLQTNYNELIYFNMSYGDISW